MSTPGQPLVCVRGAIREFPSRSSSGMGGKRVSLRAVAGVDLDILRGETLGLVGESGCGKSTLARCVVRLLPLTSGRLLFDGQDITHSTPAELKPIRRRMQMVFQDPYGSLNPRRRVGSIIAEPFRIHGLASGRELQRRVHGLMDLVGLNPEHYNRFPADFSGGQRQRIGIARALALRPDFVVCDEPVSALDVSIQAQVLNLLADLQRELSLTYLFISHDLSVVRHVSDRIAVMYLGRIVELAAADELYGMARHPYTQALLSAMPELDADPLAEGDPEELQGEPPSPHDPPSGCHFHPRCPRCQARCMAEPPVLAQAPGSAAGHQVACHFPNSTAGQSA